MSTDLYVKAVKVAINWEYKNLPPSKLRCALCLVDCSATADGPSEDIGIVRTCPNCDAVVHNQCLKKFQSSPSASAKDCPQCHARNVQWSVPKDLFGTLK